MSIWKPKRAMPEGNLAEPGATVPEIAMANAAFIRTLIVYLMGRKILPMDHVELLFDLTKEEIRKGRYDPRCAAGSIAFLDYQRRSIATREEPRESAPLLSQPVAPATSTTTRRGTAVPTNPT